MAIIPHLDHYHTRCITLFPLHFLEPPPLRFIGHNILAKLKLRAQRDTLSDDGEPKCVEIQEDLEMMVST